MKENCNTKKILKSFELMTIFLVLSVVFVLPLWVKGVVFTGDDLAYHIGRIDEIFQNFSHGNYFVGIYSYTFDKIGYPLNLFYPWITLIPFVLFKFIVSSSVTAIYCGIAFYSFLTLCFTYKVSMKVWNNKIRAILTGAIYLFSAYHTIDIYTRFALGEYLGMTFLPLTFYGIYAIIKGNYRDWPYLAFGMSMIILSHVISSVLILIVLTIIFITTFANSNRKKLRIYALVKSIMLCLLSSAVFILPFLEQAMYQSYRQPSVMDMQSQAIDFSSLIGASISNSINRVEAGGIYNIGVILFLSVIVGIFKFKTFDSITKYLYIIGVCCFVMSSKIFPWYLLQHTGVSVIQFPWRFLGIASFSLSVVASALISKIIITNLQLKKVKTILILLIIIMPWFESIQNFSSSQESRAITYSNDVGIGEMRGLFYLDQYAPKEGIPYLADVNQRIAIVNGEKTKVSKVKSGPNYLKFYSDDFIKNAKIDLPIYAYKNVKISSNGQITTPQKSNRGTITFKNLAKTSYVKVVYVPSVIDIIGITCSVFTWVLVILIFAFKFNTKMWIASNGERNNEG